MGDTLQPYPRISLEVFHAFRNERPKEEKWELIDGAPMMMPPPSLVHQRISKNIETMLAARLAVVRPDWMADREIGVLLPDDDRYNPEPDVTVIDAEIEFDQIFAKRFYFVAEVLSGSNRPERRAGSDKPIVLATKLGWYKHHEHCRGVLIARQDVIEADLHIRTKSGWDLVELREPSSRIVVPDIGDGGMLIDLYRHTPHDRKT